MSGLHHDPLVALGHRLQDAYATREAAYRAQGEVEQAAGFTETSEVGAAVRQSTEADHTCIALEVEIATTPARTPAGHKVRRDLAQYWMDTGGPPAQLAEAMGEKSDWAAFGEFMQAVGRETVQFTDPDPEGADDGLLAIVERWRAHVRNRPEEADDDDLDGYIDGMYKIMHEATGVPAHSLRGLAAKADLIEERFEDAGSYFGPGTVEALADFIADVRRLAGQVA